MLVFDKLVPLASQGQHSPERAFHYILHFSLSAKLFPTPPLWWGFHLQKAPEAAWLLGFRDLHLFRSHNVARVTDLDARLNLTRIRF
jgi:hypothetical protein